MVVISIESSKHHIRETFQIQLMHLYIQFRHANVILPTYCHNMHDVKCLIPIGATHHVTEGTELTFRRNTDGKTALMIAKNNPNL